MPSCGMAALVAVVLVAEAESLLMPRVAPIQAPMAIKPHGAVAAMPPPEPKKNPGFLELEQQQEQGGILSAVTGAIGGMAASLKKSAAESAAEPVAFMSNQHQEPIQLPHTVTHLKNSAWQSDLETLMKKQNVEEIAGLKANHAIMNRELYGNVQGAPYKYGFAPNPGSVQEDGSPLYPGNVNPDGSVTKTARGSTRGGFVKKYKKLEEVMADWHKELPKIDAQIKEELKEEVKDLHQFLKTHHSAHP